MKVTQCGVVASYIGAMLLGLVVAGVLAFAVGRLWPVMAAPVFFVTLLCWILGEIAVMRRDRGKQEIHAVSWREGNEYTTFSRTNTILSTMAATLSGFVLASLAGGVVGLFWPEATWPVFFVVLIVFGIGGFLLLLRDVFGLDIRRKI